MPSTLATHRRGATLAIVAAILLANPLYVGLFVEQPRPRSPTGYAATAVDPSTEDGQDTLIQHLGSDEILEVEFLEESRDAEQYRAPLRAAAVLRRARGNESVRVRDDAVALTLSRLGATSQFVTFHTDDPAAYYRFSVAQENDSVVVRLERATREAVARFIFHQDSIRYASLPGYQRETVDRVLAAGDSGYRPSNDEFVHLTDQVLLKGGTPYVFTERMHVDDFGVTARDLASGLLSALGFVLLLAAVIVTTLADRSASR